MEMTIEDIIQGLKETYMICCSVFAYDRKKYIDGAIDRLNKYQMMQADYENRLKADMMAMLKEIKNDLAKLKSYESVDGQDLVMLADIGIYFDKKISELEGEAPTKSCDTCRNKGSNNGVCNICHSRRKYGCWTPIGGWK